MFKTALHAWLSSIAGVVNTHAIPRLLRLNGMDVQLAPALTFGAVGDVDMDTVIAFVSQMATAGMGFFPSPELENKLRGDVGLPPLSDEDLARRAEEERRKQEMQDRMNQATAEKPAQGQDGDQEERTPGAGEMAAMFEAAQRVLLRGAYGD
jgi:hypothetical protein